MRTREKGSKPLGSTPLTPAPVLTTALATCSVPLTTAVAACSVLLWRQGFQRAQTAQTDLIDQTHLTDQTDLSDLALEWCGLSCKQSGRREFESRRLTKKHCGKKHCA